MKQSLIKVRFSASGYDTSIMRFKSKDEFKDDVYATAADYDAEVQEFGDEYVAVSRSGEEIARWEVI